jgi:uncharacterized protein YjiS (DUF1127 family)
VTSTQPYPVVSNLIDRFGHWIKQRRELNELNHLDSGEFKRMAHELGLTSGDLDALIRKGAQGAEELPELLRVLGFDEAAIARIQPPVMMEMRHACASARTSEPAEATSPPTQRHRITRIIAPMPMASRCCPDPLLSISIE